MKQMTAGAVVVLLVGLVIGVTVDAKRPAAGVSPSTAPVVKTDLMTIWSAYRRKAADADARYGGGRWVEVTGPVLTVDNKGGEACLFLFDLDLRGDRPARARCLFAAREFPTLARLLKMEKVAVRGKASWEPASMVGSSVVLHDCVLVTNEQ